MSEQSETKGTHPEGSTLAKPLIEFGPLIAFILAFYAGGIYWATGVIMVASVLALGASWIFLGRLLPVPVATAVLVVLFGGLTFLFDDPNFIKVKPTIINLLFAGLLAFGLMTRRPLLQLLFGEAFKLTDEGWRKLTIRWTFFFVFLAVLNELVRHNFSDAVWANFKFFGIIGISLVFGVAQIGLIKRYETKTGA
jgi:intracellular septation protein